MGWSPHHPLRQPEEVVPAVAAEVGASSVHISKDFGPYGVARDRKAAAALGAVRLVPTGSPYAVSPGKVTTAAGGPFRLYSAFARAWREQGWPPPATSDPSRTEWAAAASEELPGEPSLPPGLVLPAAGERSAQLAWRRFRDEAAIEYSKMRDRPDLDRTSRLSCHLKVGSLHPRTLLAELGASDSRFVAELAWREFYAAVLAAWPETARASFQARMSHLQWDDDPARFSAWIEGRTGYPLVDAGMRQLRAEGWMHNRLRMVTASFLVTDLHIDWRRGARHFMATLIDGDLASNQHGWQWSAGTGTDAAPYHRILNPVTQAKRFDPDGAYVRRFVPELSCLGAPEIFEPWALPKGPPAGYPTPIVNHSEERIRALSIVRDSAI